MIKLTVRNGQDPLVAKAVELFLSRWQERTRVRLLSRGASPAVYNRGVYVATHFNNWYEAAPLERVERYIEDMALWGCDRLTFWLDMNGYPHGFWRDPRNCAPTSAPGMAGFIRIARSVRPSPAGRGRPAPGDQPGLQALVLV